MQNFYTSRNKIVIRCARCLSKLRVPLDKGKINVECPVCKKKFIYNPDSIIHTIKQITLSAVDMLPKDKKKRIILLVTIIAVVIALFFVFLGKENRKNLGNKPGPMVYNMIQEQHTLNKELQI